MAYFNMQSGGSLSLKICKKKKKKKCGSSRSTEGRNEIYLPVVLCLLVCLKTMHLYWTNTPAKIFKYNQM